MQKHGKPAAWRGGLQVVEELEEDAQPTRTREGKGKEWAQHWQCDSRGARHEELRSLEEVLTRLKEENFDKAARSYKAATGVDRDQFRPQVLAGLSEEKL